MGGKKQKRYLTVAPFKCAWREELRFKEAGRGCVAFEAFAHNDVTLVFREQAGSQHYHYKTDNSPNYTVILGSHRNRRLKIEVDGKTVVDVAGVGLCSSSAFQSYWIGIYDGLITVGKGKQPFQDTVFQWLDSKPNCNVQYVGLSSWDKHVGYRNVNVLPLTQHNNCLRSHVDYKEYDGGYGEEGELEDASDSFEESGLPDFLESWELSDMIFVVGPEKKVVPAHRVILHAAGTFNFDSSDQNTITLPSVSYLVLRAFLEYIYTGRTEITDAQLGGLRAFSKQFQIHPLTKECEEITDRFKMNKKLFDNGKKVEISFLGSQVPLHAIFPSEFPISSKRLQKFLKVGEHSDIDIYIEGHGLVARSHKVILSLWSVPFAKMFTNGMAETQTSEIHLKDIPIEAFTAILQYMYSGELDVKEMANPSSFLVPLLLLADQFAVAALHKECCRCLLECLSEDSVCSILLAVSSVFSCKLLEETCKRFFSMHFDYCTTATTDFVMLEEEVFKDIFQDISLEIQSQHPDLTVTSEERVFDAILLWGLQADEICGWETVDKLLKSSTLERLFTERLATVETLLPSVRFPLMPPPLLNKLEESNLCSQSSVLKHLVTEAIQYSNFGTNNLGINENLRFQHRRSSFKELQYICDGDSNGVIYFAGTSYGEHQWVNPVLSKKINVTASSPISRYTDPKVLVSRTYQGTSFAGPRIENGKTCAWWMVDLGQGHQLMCNYYTLRQDGSSAYIRSWALQGSLDGQNWSNLRIHENEHTVCKPGQFSSWPIQGTMALLPFRFFRVLLIAPTTDVSNAWNLCICFIELYGYFR